MGNDLIRREDAVGILHLCFNSCNTFERRCTYAHAIKQIEKIPAVDAVPVVHGRWILEREPNGKPYCYHCSHCDSDFHHTGVQVASVFCPNCGWPMENETIIDGKEYAE